MESSLLLFVIVFIKIGLSFSTDSTFISFVSDNEIDVQNANQNFILQPDEWEFLWLTEAFISYLKFSSGEIFFNSDSEKEFIINQLQPALMHESMDLSQHMTALVHTTVLNSLMVIEDDIISHKGNCIVRMLHLSLGNSIFHQSLINYLKLSEFQLMSLDDLWYSFQYQIDRQQIKLPKDIRTIINSWIHQDGFPVVHVEIKNNIAKLRQNRYLTDGLTDNFENNTWWIPITWTSASNVNSQSTIPKYWLHKKEDEIQLQIKEDEWVIFNVQQAGFYRVNYDEVSWHRIIYALNFHHLNSISAINRASIINDAFSLANTGIIPFEIALNSITYITRETDYLPIETALKELEFLFKYFDGQNSSQLFNKFWLALIKPSYDRLSQHDQVDSLSFRKLQKNLTYWACLLGHKQCVKNVLQNFERWKNNSKILITKHEKKLMFCIAVKYNSSLEENGAIKTILNYYSKTSNISDRAIAISSLKCIKDYEILQEILKMLLSNRTENVMEKQEILYAFKVIAKNSYKDAEFMSDFIVIYHDIMLEYYGNNDIFIEIIESLFELLDVQKNSDKYYRYHTYIEEELIETVDATFKKNIYENKFYINYYTRIIKWIKNNIYFIPLDIERETKNTAEFLEVIERSFQFLKSFYEENSSSDNLFTSTNLNNSLLNASYFFWKRTFNDWANLQSKITFLNDQKILEYHMLKIVSLIYDKLGFEEKPGDTYENKVLRSDVIDWACRLNHPDCILKSLKLFKSWRSPLRSLIPKNIQKTVFCTAIKYEFEDMQFFVRKYMRTKSPHQKLAIEYALGCTSDVESIQNILSIILNIDDSRIEHQLRIISSINYYGGFGLQEILKYLCIINPRIPKDDKKIDQLYKIFEKVLTLISTHEQISLFQQCLEFYSDSIPSIDSSLLLYINQLIDDSNKFEQYSSNFLTWLRTTYISFDYRLPENLKPIKYELTIIPNFNTFYGLVKIILDVLYDSDRIVLHATDLWIVEINVLNLNTDQSIGVLFFLQQLDGRCEIYLDSVIKNNTQLLVTITYGGFINDEKYGIYYVPLNNQDKETDWIITTQFQMSHARRAFPCFDEPSFKAKFKLKILRPNDFISISNMNIIYSSLSPIKTNWSWDIYEESEIMSTYLVAFIICKHKTVSTRENYLKYWSHHSSTPYAKYSLEVVHKAIEMISAYTGISLPQKKIDFVEIPGFDMLGMENWGIVILDDQLSSLSSTRLYTNILQVITFKEFIVAHEIAHMWFGNLVTCETWEYFWINEGFARYFEWTVMDSIQPQLKWMEKFIVHIQQVAFALDSQTVSLPLTNKKLTLITRKNVNQYDNSVLIHAKAPCIVRMMYHAFGDEIFNISIKYYLQKNKWSTSTPSKLWSAIENTFRAVHYKTNESVATMMESWTSQPGYPVVHVNRTDKQLIFKQERFLSKKETEPMELYWIPITITTKSKPVFTNTLPVFWMGSRTEFRSLPRSGDDEWIIVNIQQTGFYRVNYDINTWNNIFKALNQKDFGGIPEINRAQILDDLFNLAYADYISYELAFIGAKYLSKERGYLPWKVFFNNIDNLYEKFDSLIISMNLKKYIRDLITPYYNEIQPHENFSFDHKDDFNIVQIMTWARKVDLNLLVIKSLKKFQEWLKKSETPMNIRIFTLCIVVQHSSYHEWEFLWNRYFNTPFKSEKLTLLKTFGCSRNVTTLTELIRFVVFNNYLMTEFEVKVALASIFYDERYSTDAVLNFFILYHEELNAEFLWKKVHTLLLAISRNIYTSHQIQQLKKLIEILKNKNDQIREQLQNNLSQILIKKKWFDNHIVDVMQSLAKVE